MALNNDFSVDEYKWTEHDLYLQLPAGQIMYHREQLICRPSSPQDRDLPRLHFSLCGGVSRVAVN